MTNKQYQILINEPSDAAPFERFIAVGHDAWVAVEGTVARAVSQWGDIIVGQFNCPVEVNATY